MLPQFFQKPFIPFVLMDFNKWGALLCWYLPSFSKTNLHNSFFCCWKMIKRNFVLDFQIRLSSLCCKKSLSGFENGCLQPNPLDFFFAYCNFHSWKRLLFDVGSLMQQPHLEVCLWHFIYNHYFLNIWVYRMAVFTSFILISVPPLDFN